jgi:glycosyltransferase involved in cell wall biosynthesis
MRVGVLGHDFIRWGGGIDFLRTVVAGLEQLEPPVEICLLLPTRGLRVSLAGAAAHAKNVVRKLLQRPTLRQQRFDADALRAMTDVSERHFSVHEIDQGTCALAGAAQRLKLDVVLPAFEPLPASFPVPWVGYVFDFQHRYYPHWFKPAELHERDRRFAAMATQTSALIVNAHAVADDLRRFLPTVRAEVFTLPFSAAPNQDWLTRPAGALLKYGIDNPYFIVCNQFWKHKDHRTAFAGFASWCNVNTQAHLVCTGEMEDYRDPGYAASLKTEIEQLGIAPRVHLLGRVSKIDQIDLLRGSVAMVQPTLFEGGPGGGATFDAVSLGIPCILSDISVNREISGEDVDFFKAGDARDLARSLQRAWERRMETRKGVDDLMAEGRLRRRACGQQLLRAIQHARSMSPGTKRT